MIPTVVIRHPKERLSKCSLEPLRGRDDVVFYKATPSFRFDATGFVLLHHEGEVLGSGALSMENGESNSTSAERLLSTKKHPSEISPHSTPKLLLLDSTWLLLPHLEACLMGNPQRYRLPDGVKTAYPRVSKIADNPDGGLASVEALYLARRLLGDDDPTLLDAYYWRDEFLAQFE